ncbi:MAG: hypothetical protein PHT96_06490 [Syntrophorhabdaceae bacterium]|nr:hypothetical protein [Syntrophorhabdaceae bacterium]MDD4196043.1 hypothetical protein [Syntrophorhabdaceae bacterium]HOC46587.1 hypothetical protein [Syntrophorhabdaceae bacterium]
MKKYLLASILLFVAGMLLASGSPALAELSCQEKCLSYCCTDSKCSKKKQSECYYDCLNSCNSSQKQTRPTRQPPHS